MLKSTFTEVPARAVKESDLVIGELYKFMYDNDAKSVVVLLVGQRYADVEHSFERIKTATVVAVVAGPSNSDAIGNVWHVRGHDCNAGKFYKFNGSVTLTQ